MRSRLLLVGLMLALVSVFVVGVGSAAAADPTAVKKVTPPVIVWSQPTVKATVAQLQTVTVTVTFSSTKDIPNPQVLVFPPRNNFIHVHGFPKTIKAGVPMTFELGLTWPAHTTTRTGTLMGVLVIKPLNKISGFANPLQIVVTQLKKVPSPIVAPQMTWSPPEVKATLAKTESTTVKVSFTSSKDIANPQVLLFPQRPDFVSVQNFPKSVKAGVPETFDLKLTWPAHTTTRTGTLQALLFVKPINSNSAVGGPLTIVITQKGT